MKQRVKIALFVILTLSGLVVFGCRGRQTAPPTALARPQRIVSLSPSVTEILYGIGAWPQVIAQTSCLGCHKE